MTRFVAPCWHALAAVSSVLTIAGASAEDKNH